MVRVAVAQFAIGDDRRENLATCLRMIDAAVEAGGEIVVLPEFLNHVSVYRDFDHAVEVAVEPGDDFLQPLADKAAERSIYLLANCTRRDGEVIRASNFFFAPDGSLAAVSDKHVLMGAEGEHIERGETVCPIIETPHGRIGLYSCMDGVINETPRGLALRGAQLLLNSLNSFATDEAELHVPVRAAENRVFVAAANKVGPLLPPETMAAISAGIGIAPEKIVGAGESQIVGPDGSVLAIAPLEGEAVVVADVELSAADDKVRPDGTNLVTNRRADAYAPLAKPPKGRAHGAGAETLEVAVVQAEEGNEESAALLVREAALDGAELIVIPELFCFVGAEVAGTPEDPHVPGAIEQLAEAVVGTTAVVVTSLPHHARHEGVAIDATGVIFRQGQLHLAGRHPWATECADEIEVFEARWGRLAVVTGPDSIYPEVFRLAALSDADVIAVPTHYLEAWEAATGLVERAAENRVNVVAATRPSALGTSMILGIERDFTLWTQWEHREFDGRISFPIVHRAADGVGFTRGTVYPAAASNRILTRNTDVIDSRPWDLIDALVSAP